jgi:hypothetical protein
MGDSIVTAACVAHERLETGGRVLDAKCVTKQCISTVRRVVAGLVVLKCTKTIGCVEAACCIAD